LSGLAKELLRLNWIRKLGAYQQQTQSQACLEDVRWALGLLHFHTLHSKLVGKVIMAEKRQKNVNKE
jgi:hypothetical protein